VACTVDGVLARLRPLYGEHRWRRHRAPLDELVMTVLSQHTSDRNTEAAFRSLRQRFPTWEEVSAAPTAAVIEAIRSGGLANRKGPRIQAILAAVRRERGVLDLDHLAADSSAAAREWLLGLEGVGPKTAACVQLFSLGQPALPVDTHVHRVARRVGLLRPKVRAEAAQPVLERLLGEDRDRVYDFHLTLIAHGRSLCRAQRPACGRCPLNDCCDAYLLTPPAAADDAVPPDRR